MAMSVCVGGKGEGGRGMGGGAEGGGAPKKTVVTLLLLDGACLMSCELLLKHGPVLHSLEGHW